MVTNKKFFRVFCLSLLSVNFLQSIEKSTASLCELPTTDAAELYGITDSQSSPYALPVPDVSAMVRFQGHHYNLFLLGFDAEGKLMLYAIHREGNSKSMHLLHWAKKTATELTQEECKKIIEIKKELLNKTIQMFEEEQQIILKDLNELDEILAEQPELNREETEAYILKSLASNQKNLKEWRFSLEWLLNNDEPELTQQKSDS